MSAVVQYFASYSAELAAKSRRMRSSFASHHPSAGTNREDIVADFLRQHLPRRYGLASGLILSKEGVFSNEADVVVYDSEFSSPLHPESPKKLFFVESVLGVIEVKTYLDPAGIKDAVAKCRRFKKLHREFDPLLGGPRAKASLFCVWAFEGPSPEILKKNYAEALAGVPVEEHPDFVLVQDSALIVGGSYRIISTIGQEGSPHRQQIMQRFGGDLTKAMGGEFIVIHAKEHALMVWIIWARSFFAGAVPRAEIAVNYLPPDGIYGQVT